MNPMIKGVAEIETDMIKVEMEAIEVIGICAIERDLAQGQEVKRRDATTEDARSLLRVCEKKTKDVDKEKE